MSLTGKSPHNGDALAFEEGVRAALSVLYFNHHASEGLRSLQSSPEGRGVDKDLKKSNY